jgi:hypothetical protein
MMSCPHALLKSNQKISTPLSLVVTSNPVKCFLLFSNKAVRETKQEIQANCSSTVSSKYSRWHFPSQKTMTVERQQEKKTIIYSPLLVEPGGLGRCFLPLLDNTGSLVLQIPHGNTSLD